MDAMNLKNFTTEELKKIGRRMRSARSLTELNQQQFADKYGLSYTTLKNFENARNIPRENTIRKFAEALCKEGVPKSFEWLVYGTEKTVARSEKVLPLDEQVVLREVSFLREILSKDKNNLVIAVARDDFMLPFYATGDYLLGNLISLKDISVDQMSRRPFLVQNAEKKYVPRWILKENRNYYSRNNVVSELSLIKNDQVGAILWHRICEISKI